MDTLQFGIGAFMAFTGTVMAAMVASRQPLMIAPWIFVAAIGGFLIGSS